MLKPSFVETPWPRVLKRRKRVAWKFVGLVTETGVGEAGDCELAEVALVCGGSRARADFVGSWGRFFDVDTVVDLLIL